MLSCELRAALSGETTPKFLATLDAAGRPNCVPVISLAPWDETTLVFGEFFMNKTRRNLLVNTKVGVAVINERLEGWSLKGTFLGFETAGERVEWLNQTPLFRYNAYTSARSVGTIAIEEVWALPALSRSRLVFDFARVRLLAALVKGRGRTCMPGRVHEKFQRTKAVRALAFRGEDGYPRALPLVACVGAGSGRLVMRAPMVDGERVRLARDTEVAVAVITMEPIAYQVKGRYRGGIAGCGVVDLTECYSASPPLVGERLDRAGKSRG
ncbi:MAG: pyridoxamine 5'-phosphate oxidase family protein [Candidatus Hydrogenedentes bacterium]|nr:pyridoxamine 5'-phosphate oxidase family protein [Candidatus Hydrogenedentota bacterium]